MSTIINERLSDSYNETPYHSHPFQQSTPEHLSAIATLFNVTSVPIEQARILEIGCASGGNIIPLALRFPQAKITGIDLSQVHIAEGQANVTRLGLENISLLERDLSKLTPDFGTFDYIIAHGVYSWIPEEVQAGLMRICGENLSENGLAYISYNTYPGWKYREVIRDAMMFRGASRDTPQEKLSYARGMIDFLHDYSHPDSLTRKNIDEVLPILKSSQDYYLIHEFLEHCNNPCYFHELIARAKDNGLHYLAESHLPGMFLSNFSAEITEPLLRECRGSQIAVEQHLDFLTGRSFRQTILLKAARANQINYQLNTTQLQKLHYAGVFKAKTPDNNENGPLIFTPMNKVEIQFTHPLAEIAAQILDEHYPSTLQIVELTQLAKQRSQQSGQNFTDEECLTTVALFIENMIIKGMIRTRSNPVKLDTQIAEYPLRHEQVCQTETKSDAYTNVWHETIHLNVVEKSIFHLLDGRHSHAQLHAQLLQDVANGLITFSNQGVQVTDPEKITLHAQEHLQASLYNLKRNGLLAR